MAAQLSIRPNPFGECLYPVRRRNFGIRTRKGCIMPTFCRYTPNSRLQVFHHQCATKRRHRRAKQQHLGPHSPRFKVLPHPLHSPFAFIAPVYDKPFPQNRKGLKFLQSKTHLPCNRLHVCPAPQKSSINQVPAPTRSPTFHEVGAKTRRTSWRPGSRYTARKA